MNAVVQTQLVIAATALLKALSEIQREAEKPRFAIDEPASEAIAQELLEVMAANASKRSTVRKQKAAPPPVQPEPPPTLLKYPEEEQIPF